ncbi:MAG: HNH endonuclease [Defluviitaleaceae bacterium]|nr:HNH endonuclease [Defluviitaleaceae bacterium]MCL2240135.1 HNH endonuclease [Defluviitaleaceae bacterium]
MLAQNFIPKKPFPDFKWKWASFAPSEGLNDPVVLLGVLFRMHKLEPLRVRFSSDEFAQEMRELSKDIKDSGIVDYNGNSINLERTPERNLIRNSGQYWKAVGLLADTRGEIRLTDFGRRVAEHDVSQTEFAAITVQTFKLPNAKIHNTDERKLWADNGLSFYPLRLLLSILRELNENGQGYITTEELVRIIIPLSGCKAEVSDYVNFILWFRAKIITLIGWPDCTPGANDLRIAREYLLFLSHYGYINRIEQNTRMDEQYLYNDELDAEITAILAEQPKDESLQQAVDRIRVADVASDIERKRVESSRRSRPNQARFRKEVLAAYERCVITNVMMPEVLEAAHIKPYKYNGEDTVANGFPMRMDIHLLFDAGHLRISVEGQIELSNRARLDYGATVPPRIYLPDFTSREFLRWRWENYNGL